MKIKFFNHHDKDQTAPTPLPILFNPKSDSDSVNTFSFVSVRFYLGCSYFSDDLLHFLMIE